MEEVDNLQIQEKEWKENVGMERSERNKQREFKKSGDQKVDILDRVQGRKDNESSEPKQQRRKETEDNSNEAVIFEWKDIEKTIERKKKNKARVSVKSKATTYGGLHILPLLVSSFF